MKCTNGRECIRERERKREGEGRETKSANSLNEF